MSNATLLCFMELSVITVGALMVANRFYTLHDGILRKLMIWYFSIEVFTFVSLGLYLALLKFGLMNRVELYFVVLLFPKLCMKIRLIYYLIFNK